MRRFVIAYGPVTIGQIRDAYRERGQRATAHALGYLVSRKLLTHPRKGMYSAPESEGDVWVLPCAGDCQGEM